MEKLSDHVYCDVDFNELLIGDSVTDLNGNRAKEVYCFTEEQVKEIVRRCRFKCSVYKLDNTYIIRRDETYKSKKKGAKAI